MVPEVPTGTVDATEEIRLFDVTEVIEKALKELRDIDHEDKR